ncbi:MAG: hypothetical protein AAGC85_16275 [Bacteroidota bacterium]
MMKIRFGLSLLICLSFTISGFSQENSLPSIEKKLATLADDILLHDSLSFKIQQNKEFTSLLINTLKRPESFTYSFDSLRTISILEPEDKSFRIFTWHIVDQNYREYFGDQYYYYFGLVQRKYVPTSGPVEYIVIPLIEMPTITKSIENTLLDNNNWLGAQYYPPKNINSLPKHTLKYYGQKLVKGKPQKIKQDFYVLLGWNGNDKKSNYKIVEVMTFDPDKKDKVIFGADVFYFDIIPKFRGFFKYSDNAPFTLNYGYVKSGPFKLFKKPMIIYDHLAAPKQKTMKEIWEYGPDGSYDALSFFKRGGYFEWYRNVELAEKYNNKLKQKQLRELREGEQNKIKEAGIRLGSNQ